MNKNMKNWKLYAMILMAGVAFTACDDDEETTTPGTTITLQDESTGVLILNNGNKSANIDGDFSVIDYSTASVTNGVFSARNNRSLGATPNRALIYGSKIYVAVNISNTIEIADRNTFASVKQIALADNETIKNPRDVIAKDGYVYVSLYSGHVARIDTTTLEIDATVEVGKYPEIMTISGDYLYVPNSNYGSGNTVSQISLPSFTKTKDITVPVNPVQMASDAQGNVYVLSAGWYDTANGYKQMDAALFKLNLNGEEHTRVADATIIDIPEGSNVLYAVNSPYGGDGTTYFKVNLAAGDGNYTQTPLPISVDSPLGIGADPVNDNIVLTSYELVNGKASYNTPGYANVYNSEGTLLKTYKTGVGPRYVYFLTGKKLVMQ